MTAPRATGRATALAVAALTVVAALLRTGSLDRSLWLDEAWRANIALAPTADAFWRQVLGSGGGGLGAPMPPLFVVALRAAGRVVGHSAAGMRALPVLASVAAVPLAFAVGRRAAGTTAGLAAALCFVGSPTTLLHGQELKQYSTDIVAVLVLLLAASAVAATPGRTRAWAALAIAMSIVPGFSYPAALVFPGVAIATLAYCGDGGARRRWLASNATAALAAAAWFVLVIGPQRHRPNVTAYWAEDFPPFEGPPSAAWVGARLLDFVSYCSLHPAWLGALVVVVGLALAARWLGIAALVTLATLVVAASARVYPLAGGRTTVFLLPFVYVALGAAIGTGCRTPSRLLVAIAAVALAVPMLRSGFIAPTAGVVYEETAPLIAMLDAERRPDDRVYVYDGAVQAFRFHHPALDDAITLGGSHRSDPAAYTAELRPLLVPGRRLWVLFAHVFTPAGGRPETDTILADLSLYARRIDVRERPGAVLYLYEVTRAPDAIRHMTLTPEDLKNPEKMKELFGR